jgi:hypothetical protein
MTSLGFSEYAETSNNDNSRPGNGNGKIYNRRNGGNRTLKIPRNNDATAGPQAPHPNGTNDGVVQQAGKKIKQIKDYIESIHRKGGEDSEEDGEDGEPYSALPSYPAQGMGVYSSNVSHSGIIRGPDTLSSNTSSSSAASASASSPSHTQKVVYKTTQMNSLNPNSSYSSTLLEGMDSAMPPPSSPYFDKLMGTAGAPKKDPHAQANVETKSAPFSTNAYASQYYEQFVPYAESLAGQLSATEGGSKSGTNAALIEKLNYIIHMLEDKKDEKTGHVIEELVLYCFLGVFIIFIVDTFTHVAVGGGGARSSFGMFSGRRAKTLYYR